MTASDREWTSLLTLDDPSLESAITDRIVTINHQAADQQAAAMAGILQAEAEMDGPQLKRLIIARFRAWLNMPPEEVQTFSAHLDQARTQASGASALRSTSADQSAARDLSPDDCMRLLEIAPSFARALPQEIHEMIASAARRDASDVREAAAATVERPFWKFWQR